LNLVLLAAFVPDKKRESGEYIHEAKDGKKGGWTRCACFGYRKGLYRERGCCKYKSSVVGKILTISEWGQAKWYFPLRGGCDYRERRKMGKNRIKT